LYRQFYGIRHHPFTLTPDPRFLYTSASVRQALAGLAHCVRRRSGFLMLSGEVGTGKTTLLRSLMDSLQRAQWPSAFLVNPTLRPNELLEYVTADLGVPVTGGSKSALLFALSTWLVKLNAEGKTATVIIDEAHALSDETLEEIRFLTNLETSDAKLVQVILAGQPELVDRLEQPHLRQIKQRLYLRCALLPLTREEVGSYVNRRLLLAGTQAPAIFTAEAINALHRFSGGIPRVINTLCEHALINGFAHSRKPLHAADIEEVAIEFGFAHEVPTEDSLQPRLVGLGQR